jgi:hypothetical protein
MIGYAGSMILPMQLGELVRAFIASRQLGLRGTALLSSILLERLLDFLSLLLVVGIALIAGAEVPPALVTAGWVIGAAGAAFGAAAVAYVWWTSRFVTAIRMSTAFLPTSLQSRILDQVQVGADGLHALRRPMLLVKVVLLSLAQWGCMWACVYLSLLALDIHVPISAAFVTLAYTVIGVTLPTSPGYIGSIQLAYALALQPFGVGPEAAFAASIFFHALANVSVIVVGFYYLQRLGYRFRDLRHQAAAQTRTVD